MKTIPEEITELEGARELKLSRMSEITNCAEAEDRQVSEEEAMEFNALEADLRNIDAEIRKKKVQAYSAGTAKPVDGTSMRGASTSRGPTILVRKEDPDDEFQGQSFVRRIIAKAMAYNSHGDFTAAQVAEHRWGKTHPKLVNWIKNADVSAGTTGDAAFAGRLVTPDSRFAGDFIEYLAGITVFERLPLRPVPANVTIKGQDGISTAYWPGEAHAIPMSEQSFTTINLAPKKVSALTSLSNEVIRDSSPSAEMLVRDGLGTAIAQKLDSTFFGTSDAVTSGGIDQPAGILYNVSGIPTAGPDAAGVSADVLALYQAFLTNKAASGVVLCMHPGLAKVIGLMRNMLGGIEFPGLGTTGGQLLGDTVYTGDNIDPNHVIALRPTDIWRIGDMGIQVSISQDASLEMANNPDMNSGTPAGPNVSNKVVSMFQTDSTAFKVVRPVNFQKRRTFAAQFINNADYNLSGTIETT